MASESMSTSSSMLQYQHRNTDYHNLINGHVNAYLGANHSSRQTIGSSCSTHSDGYGRDQNMNSEAGRDRGSTTANALDWQMSVTAAVRYNNNGNHESEATSANVSKTIGNSYSTQMGADPEDASVLHQRGDDGNASPNTTNDAGIKSTRTAHPGPTPRSSVNMSMMNSYNSLIHPGIVADPNSLAGYMNMGNMNMHMNMNMGLNTMGYAGLQGFSVVDTKDPSSILTSAHINPQAFFTGFDGESGGMNISSIGGTVINNMATMGLHGLKAGGVDFGVMGGQRNSQDHSLPPRIHKPVKVRRKKPKDHPSRPLSAYNLFFKDERKRLMESSTDDKGDGNTNNNKGNDSDADGVGTATKKRQLHGKLSFESLGKTIGARWRKIDPERLKHYQALARIDHSRYEREMKVYEQKLKDLRAKEEADRLEQQKQKLKKKEEKKCEQREVKEEKRGNEDSIEQSLDQERQRQDADGGAKSAQVDNYGRASHKCDIMKVVTKASSRKVDCVPHSKEDEIMRNDATPPSSTSSNPLGKRSRHDGASIEGEQGIAKKGDPPVLPSKKPKTGDNTLRNTLHDTSQLQPNLWNSIVPDIHATTSGPSLMSSRHNNDLGKDCLLNVHRPTRNASHSLSSILLKGSSTSDLLMKLSGDAPINLDDDSMNGNQEILQLLQRLQKNLLHDHTGAGGVGTSSISSLLAAQEIPEFAISTLSGGTGSREGGGLGDVHMYMDRLRQVQMTNGMMPSTAKPNTARNAMLMLTQNDSSSHGDRQSSAPSKNGDDLSEES